MESDLEFGSHCCGKKQLLQGYRVATISRLLKIIGLFCKRALQKRLYSALSVFLHELCQRLQGVFICTRAVPIGACSYSRIRIFSHVHTFTHTHTNTHTHTCVNMLSCIQGMRDLERISMYIYIYLCICTHKHTYTCICIYIYTYEYIYIYI